MTGPTVKLFADSGEQEQPAHSNNALSLIAVEENPSRVILRNETCLCNRKEHKLEG